MKRLQSSPTARVPPCLSQLTLTACCCRRKGKPPQPALQAGYNPAPAASRERMTLFSRELCTHCVPMPGHQGSTAPTKPAPGRYKHAQPLLAASEKGPVWLQVGKDQPSVLPVLFLCLPGSLSCSLQGCDKHCVHSFPHMHSL